MIIGLTGTKASGKGIIAGMLKEKGFVYCSLSDLVREEAVRRGLNSYNVSDLQGIGNELREKYGNGILAKRILEKIKEAKDYVIDGIREPEEINEIKRCKSRKFILISVDAPQKLRFKRLLERGRESDPKDWQGFLKMDRRDRGIDKENNGQQVDKCIEMADIKIYNGSSIEVLKNKTEKILKDLRC